MLVLSFIFHHALDERCRKVHSVAVLQINIILPSTLNHA